MGRKTAPCRKRERDQMHSGMEHLVPRTLQGYCGGTASCSIVTFRYTYHKSPPVLQWFVLKIELGVAGAWAVAAP